jgi:hypothetical protein
VLMVADCAVLSKACIRMVCPTINKLDVLFSLLVVDYKF